MRSRTAIVTTTTAAGALALALSACSSSTSTPGMDRNASPMPGMNASTSASMATGRAGDIMFAQMMIPHHQQAIEMADIALDRSSASARVRDLASRIKAAQDPEITQMRGWLSSWGAATTPAGGMDHGMGSGMMSGTDLTALRAAEGAEFDRRWLTGMIAHHQGAVMMANQVLATTTDPAVKTLADAIVAAQTSEITTMRALL